VGCAERYSGGLSSAQVVKVHLRSRKLTLLRYANFEVSPIPRLEIRVKVDLERRQLSEFDHWADDQRLLFKSRLMAPEQPGYAAQAAFDAQVKAKGLEHLGLRTTYLRLQAALRACGQGQHGG
jgi:hypothetical protein